MREPPLVPYGCYQSSNLATMIGLLMTLGIYGSKATTQSWIIRGLSQ